jgi:chitin synthase
LISWSLDYDENCKLLFVVADGIVTGNGNPKPTNEIVLDMIEVAEWSLDPPKLEYRAVASGAKRANRAQAFAGYFVHNGRRVPTILVSKCGMPEEANAAKPGNRGKRDSQILLMQTLRSLVYDDRMSPLEFDIVSKVNMLGQHSRSPMSSYTAVLMVDADTVVYPDSMTVMVQALKADDKIMALCGETLVANKAQSWVTAIQVFEYCICHHLGKAFESVFGGVTCLPGKRS